MADDANPLRFSIGFYTRTLQHSLSLSLDVRKGPSGHDDQQYHFHVVLRVVGALSR